MGGFDYLDPAGDDSWEEINKLLERSTQGQRERLERELDRIYRQLEQRDELYEEAVERIELQIKRYAKKLRQMYGRPFGGNPEKRQSLREELADLYGELRVEHRHHWRDRQELEQERRAVLRRLEEVADSEQLFYPL